MDLNTSETFLILYLLSNTSILLWTLDFTVVVFSLVIGRGFSSRAYADGRSSDELRIRLTLENQLVLFRSLTAS